MPEIDSQKSFNEAYKMLMARSLDRNHGEFMDALRHCVKNYDNQNNHLLEKQVQLVSDAVWKDPKWATSSVCGAFLLPYIMRPAQFTPEHSFFDHPNIIRTCLTTAKLLDDKGGFMDDSERKGRETFILSIPTIDQPGNSYAPLFARTGRALLGEPWSAVETLYSLQVDGMIAFRQAVFDVPSDILRQMKSNEPAPVHIPDSLIP